MKKWLFFISVSIIAVIGTGFHLRNTREVKVKITLEYNPGPPLEESEFTYLSVPKGKYEDLFAEKIGSESWTKAKDLFRKRAGLKRFAGEDVFTVEKKSGRIISFNLHHYRNRSFGKKISFIRRGNEFEKREKPIILTVNSLIQNFTVSKSFKDDFPQFHELAKKRLVWDWALLDKLAPGDSISFLVKGKYDEDILVHPYGILGFSVKSETLGNFTLTSYRDFYYGDYFTADGEMLMSPSGFFRVPIDYGRITSMFGWRRDPFTRRRRRHNGIDIIAKRGAPVHAAQEGKVIFTGRKGNYGKTIIIQHKDGLRTLYAHLNNIYIRRGSSVKMGDRIGAAGNSGRSTSTHLHFTVFKNRKAVDPLQFTYERLWTPPYDIAESFTEDSRSRQLALEESARTGNSFFLEEYLAEKAVEDKK